MKRFIYRIIITIFVLVISTLGWMVFDHYRDEYESPYATGADLNNALRRNFGYVQSSISDDEVVIRQEVVLTALNMLDAGTLTEAAGKDSSESDIRSEENLMKIALERGYLDKKNAGEPVTIKKMDQLVDSISDIYFKDVKEDDRTAYNDNVLTVDSGVKVEPVKDGENGDVLLITPAKNQEITEGTIVSYRDERGIVNFKKVSGLLEKEQDQVKAQTVDVEDISEIGQVIDASGNADFSYLEKGNEGTYISGENDGYDTALTYVGSDENGFNAAAGVPVMGNIFVSQNEYSTKKTNIKLTITKKKGEKPDISYESSGNSVADLISFGVNAPEEYKKLKKRSEELDPYKQAEDYIEKKKSEAKVLDEDLTNALKPEDDNDNKPEVRDGESDKDNAFSHTFTDTVEIKGLSISADTYIDKRIWKLHDEKNHIKVNVKCDSITNTSKLDLAYNKEFELGTFVLPVGSTPLNVKIKLFIKVDASGSLVLTCKLVKPQVGVVINAEDGVKPCNKISDAKFDFYANVDVEAGPKCKAELCVGNVILMDPSVSVTGRLTAETQKKPYGYEDYLPCTDVNVYFPLVDMDVMSKSTHVVAYDLIKFVGLDNGDDNQFHFNPVNEDNAPFQKTVHVEFDKDYTVSMLKGDKSVCTHMDLQRKKEELDRKKAEERQKQLDELKRKKRLAEEAAEKALAEKILNKFEDFLDSIDEDDLEKFGQMIGFGDLDGIGGCY